MKPGSPPSGSGRAALPVVLPSAAAVIAAALAQTASAETRRGATLDVRVTVVGSCAATSAAGASPKALGAACGGGTPGGPTVVVEDDRDPRGAGRRRGAVGTAALAGPSFAGPSLAAGEAASGPADAWADAPIAATEEEAGPGLRYVTIIY
jgi:hypothetical protein